MSINVCNTIKHSIVLLITLFHSLHCIAIKHLVRTMYLLINAYCRTNTVYYCINMFCDTIKTSVIKESILFYSDLNLPIQVMHLSRTLICVMVTY